MDSITLIAATVTAGAAEQDHKPEPATRRVWVDAGGQGRRGDNHSDLLEFPSQCSHSFSTIVIIVHICLVIYCEGF